MTQPCMSSILSGGEVSKLDLKGGYQPHEEFLSHHPEAFSFDFGISDQPLTLNWARQFLCLEGWLLVQMVASQV